MLPEIARRSGLVLLSGASLFPGDTLHAPLNLVVRIDEAGFTLTTSSGPIAPGCAGKRPRILTPAAGMG